MKSLAKVVSACVCVCVFVSYFYSPFRVHCLAGAFPRKVSSTEPVWLEAQATYVSNLRYAAEEGAKVVIYLVVVCVAVLCVVE